MAKATKKALPTPPPGKSVYYLIDQKITSPRLGDVPIETAKAGERYVTMNPKQAEYWIDQGAIAEQLPATKQAEVVHSQVIGEGADVIKKR